MEMKLCTQQAAPLLGRADNPSKPFKAIKFDQGMASRKRSSSECVSLASYFQCGFRCHEVSLRKAFQAVHPSSASFYEVPNYCVNAMIAKLDRERMVFERFLLPVSLAEGEAGKALGGQAVWRTENERGYYVRPSSVSDFKENALYRLAG
jgi:hypothetical protein